MEDSEAFARLIRALRPWLGHVVVVGGWAHRLHRLHALAITPAYEPIRTRDVDIALSLHAPVEGDIRAALEQQGFTRAFLGTDSPPVTHYRLDEGDGGFYTEFLVPLIGGELKRNGEPDVTASKAGINAQKLRYLDLLMVAPWSVHIGPGEEIPFEEPLDVLVPNAVSFIVQKLLIHDKRKGSKKAQDVLYIHDTLELFGSALDELHRVWAEGVRPAIPKKTAQRVERTASSLFAQVTDTIREAARIPVGRTLTPQIIRGACDYGLGEVLGA